MAKAKPAKKASKRLLDLLNKAIALYRTILEEAQKASDSTTNRLLRGILADEEEHHDYFSTLLEK